MHLGKPVVPEEYMMTQTSSGLTSAPRARGAADATMASYSSPSVPSGVTTMTCSTWVNRPRILSTDSFNSAPTMISFAPQSLTT